MCLLHLVQALRCPHPSPLACCPCRCARCVLPRQQLLRQRPSLRWHSLWSRHLLLMARDPSSRPAACPCNAAMTSPHRNFLPREPIQAAGLQCGGRALASLDCTAPVHAPVEILRHRLQARDPVQVPPRAAVAAAGVRFRSIPCRAALGCASRAAVALRCGSSLAGGRPACRRPVTAAAGGPRRRRPALPVTRLLPVVFYEGLCLLHPLRRSPPYLPRHRGGV